jgi:catalase
MEDWGREELISNLVGALTVCDQGIQERMVSHLTQCDEEYGRRVAEGLALQTKPEASAAAAK